MRTTIPCPICASTSPRGFNATGLCLNAKGCNARRCRKRIRDDRRRRVREQCHATFGKRSVRFCELTVGHDGLHLNGTHEWSGDHEAPIAKLIRARTGT